CPICERSIPAAVLTAHASECGTKPRCAPRALEQAPPPVVDERAGWQKLGIALIEDFVTPAEEQALLEALFEGGGGGGCTNSNGSTGGWKTSRFSGVHRAIQWGVVMEFRARKVVAGDRPPIPDFLDAVIERICALPALRDCQLGRGAGAPRGWRPTEANAIDYDRDRGDFLAPHVDDRHLSQSPIVNLCLLGDAVMVYERSASAGLPERVEVQLRRRALQVMQGKARYDYTHAIPRENFLNGRRVSITFRCSRITAAG
ncbi:unnamed protein product, partial [Phaeothamnion confervicola]